MATCVSRPTVEAEVGVEERPQTYTREEGGEAVVHGVLCGEE